MTYTHRLHASIYLFTMLLCSCNIQDSTSAGLPQSIKPTTHAQIQHLFDQFDYRWSTLDQGVPNITVQNFPADMGTIPNVKQKKRLFFLSLLPMVLTENAKVSLQRQKLEKLFAQYDTTHQLSPHDQQWLKRLTKEYRFKHDPFSNENRRAQLLSRVDTIPAALVLAQAANESAYGTSRFAQQANNIFGEWTFTPGTGIVPKGRPEGETYEVKKFITLSQSIRSYINNLNTHSAYSDLRLAREAMRRNHQPLHAITLAEGLLNYSTRRSDYVAEIKTMIHYNQLSQLSHLSHRVNTEFVADVAPPISTKQSSRSHRSIADYL